MLLALSETFEALVAGLQGALWTLGAVPAVLRHDNLSAATHELKRSGGRQLTVRFQAGAGPLRAARVADPAGEGARERRGRAAVEVQKHHLRSLMMMSLTLPPSRRRTDGLRLSRVRIEGRARPPRAVNPYILAPAPTCTCGPSTSFSMTGTQFSGR